MMLQTLAKDKSLLILLAWVFLFISGCGTDATKEVTTTRAWDQVGFEGENIQFVRSEGGAVYLAADTELYRSDNLSD
jgi:hypothetical protein